MLHVISSVKFAFLMKQHPAFTELRLDMTTGLGGMQNLHIRCRVERKNAKVNVWVGLMLDQVIRPLVLLGHLELEQYVLSLLPA